MPERVPERIAPTPPPRERMIRRIAEALGRPETVFRTDGASGSDFADQGELLRIWEATGTTILFVTHSIPESVFLSQQVLVLSSHPGRVRELVTIDLPYPRKLEVRETPQFTAIAAHLRRLLETC